MNTICMNKENNAVSEYKHTSPSPDENTSLAVECAYNIVCNLFSYSGTHHLNHCAAPVLPPAVLITRMILKFLLVCPMPKVFVTKSTLQRCG